MSRGRIRILFLIDYFHRTGGTEKHLAQLVTGLPANRFRCAIVGFDFGRNALLEELRARGIPVTHLPVDREYVPNAVVQAYRLWRLIRRGRYDIVQTYHQKADTYGALIARAAGVRYLISSKRDTGELRKPLHVFLNRRLRGLFDAFIMAAEGVRSAVVARDHLLATRTKTIYNGVDTSVFKPPSVSQRSAARVRLDFEPHDFVVGMVAGFRPEKNHDVFFRALALAASAIPSLRVLAVGGGGLLEHYQRCLKDDAPVGRRTVFAGDVSDVLPYLWAMDVGCLTPGSNEGFSNAIVEQMSTGLPMVVTNVGGNAEAVLDGENGFVIPSGDPEALAAALVRVYESPGRREAMGCAARRRVQQCFSLEHMCSEHARLYTELCGSVPLSD